MGLSNWKVSLTRLNRQAKWRIKCSLTFFKQKVVSQQLHKSYTILLATKQRKQKLNQNIICNPFFLKAFLLNFSNFYQLLPNFTKFFLHKRLHILYNKIMPIPKLNCANLGTGLRHFACLPCTA